jgi:uncharacterized protein (UPF0332 family)
VIDWDGTFLGKARESVTGARVEFEGGRYNNSANRNYCAVFQAAIHALQMEGVRPPRGGIEWSHAFVDSQFSGLLIHRRHRYGSDLRNVISPNRDLRSDADYTMDNVSQADAARALRRAERFMETVVRRHEEQR